jgi:glutamate--cysteine ligase
MVPGALQEGFGYRDYAEYALDVPMFFIHRGGRYVDYAGRSFREFMAKGFDGYEATEEDWALHLTTLFPEVRVKSYIELRMADAGPREMICALAAITRGLFYDDTSLDDAALLLRDVKAADFPRAIEDAARWGLYADLHGRPLREWARELLAIADAGLKRLNVVNTMGQDERIFLAPLETILQSGKSRARVMMELWAGAWNQSLDPLFTQSYFH